MATILRQMWHRRTAGNRNVNVFVGPRETGAMAEHRPAHRTEFRELGARPGMQEQVSASDITRKLSRFRNCKIALKLCGLTKTDAVPNSLVHLDLEDRGIDSEDVQRLASVLVRCKSLTYFGFSGNN